MGPGPQCLPRADTGRTTARWGGPCCPQTDSGSAKGQPDPDTQTEQPGLRVQLESESCRSAPSGPLRPWWASARCGCCAQRQAGHTAAGLNGRPGIPGPNGRPRTPRPKRKARDPAEGLGPRGLNRRPGSCCMAGLPPGLRADSRGPGAWQGHPTPSGESVNHRPRLGFHCTFIPCFTPCIPERTVFNHFRLVGSDSKDPTNTPHVPLQVHTHVKISAGPR